jgi:hypothetical protein
MELPRYPNAEQLIAERAYPTVPARQKCECPTDTEHRAEKPETIVARVLANPDLQKLLISPGKLSM